jgi:four helix bundle protein
MNRQDSGALWMRGRSWIIAPLPIDSLGMKILVRAEELKARTKRFAIRIVQLSQSLPKTNEARVIGNQVLRSGTSIAANYRATCRARSRAEFLAKLGIVVEEADETVFRLEFLEETGILGQDCV